MLIQGLRRRSFLIRYVTLFGGEAFSKLCVMASFAYLARVLAPKDFGIIELALSITVFFTLGAESGLGSYGARVIAATPTEASTLIPRVGLIRAALSLPSYLVLLGISLWYGMPGIGILAVYGGTVLLTPLATQWVFQGLRQMQWVAFGTALRASVFVTLVFALVRPGTHVETVAAAEVCGATALAIFNTAMIFRVLKVRLAWRGLWSGAARLFRSAWYLGASDIAWAIAWYSPTAILGILDIGRTEEVAWLGSSVRIVMALHTFVFLYFFNLLPSLAKELHEGVDAWRTLVRRSLSSSMWAACFVALSGTLLAPYIVRVIYGAAYGAAVVPFQIVVWMIPVTWFSGHFRFSLIAAGRQDLEFRCSALAAATTATLAFFGSSLYGSTGAAVALLSGSVAHTLLSGMAATFTIGSVGLRPTARPVVACGAAAVIQMLVTWLAGPFAAGVVACGLYSGMALRQVNFAKLASAWEVQQM